MPVRQYPRSCGTYIRPVALTNVTLPYIEALAGKGFRKAINDDEGLRQGVTTYQGHITSKPVAKGLNREYTSIDELA